MLARHHVNLQLAKITTLGERVEDTFLIDGSALQQNKQQIEIERTARRDQPLMPIVKLPADAALARLDEFDALIDARSPASTRSTACPARSTGRA